MVLSEILTSISSKLPHQKVPGVNASFIPQITLDKMEIEFVLTFPLSNDVDAKKLYKLLKSLALHASGEKKFNPARSLIHGGMVSRGYHEDDPTGWHQGMLRLPECRHSMVISPRKQNRRYLPGEHPRLPGRYAAYRPEWPFHAKGEVQLPKPLHTCRALVLDCAKVKDDVSPEDALPGGQFLRATFTLELNINRALSHHPFMSHSTLTDEQVAQAFFPNPNISGPEGMDNFCDPALPQAAIVQAVRNTIDATMCVLYADLCRALAHVPELPLEKKLPESWQAALKVARLSLVEVDRHLYVKDAPKAFSESKRQLSTWRENYRVRTHGSRADETGRWNAAVDETPTSISTILRMGKRRSSSPEASVIVYNKRRDYLRMELRLRGHGGICYDMPTIPQGRKHKPILMKDGKAYDVPKRTNVADSLDALVEVIEWVMISSQETFQRLLGTLAEVPTYTPAQMNAFIESLRRAVTKEEEQPALDYITSTLKEGQPLRAGMAGDATVDRILRRLGDRKLFLYKGGQKTRRYYPSIPTG